MIKVILLILPILFFPLDASPHSGRTDKHGCHTNRSTGVYHCHGGSTKGTTKQSPSIKEVQKPKPEELYKQTAQSKVVRVIDGDTFVGVVNGKEERIRLIGIDTPETVHPRRSVEPYGKEASNFTKKHLENQSIKLEFDVQYRDRYNRILAYVYLPDGTMLNELLVEEGYAQVSTYPPNVKYQELFLKKQKEAREKNKGLWGLE